MAKRIKTETYVLPEYWASALINGDTSGMEEDDIEAMNYFLNSDNMKGKSCVSCSDEPYFTNFNHATNLGGNVLEYTFHILK